MLNIYDLFSISLCFVSVYVADVIYGHCAYVIETVKTGIKLSSETPMPFYLGDHWHHVDS